MRNLILLLMMMMAASSVSQELNEAAQMLKNASDKDLADFYDCIENRAVLKYGQVDNTQQIEYINQQSDALFEYFELRDSLINDPAAASYMLKVAWKWGAREGGGG